MQVKKILNGRVQGVKTYFKTKMIEAAAKMDYELAEEMKKKYMLIQSFQAKSEVVNPKISNIYAYTIIAENDYAYINSMRIIEGKIIQSNNIEIKRKLDESLEDILAYAIIISIKEECNKVEKVISNIPINHEIRYIDFIMPKRGDMKKIVDLSVKNALIQKRERDLLTINLKSNRKSSLSLIQLQSDLNLKYIPYHIECFDNSNIQGKHPVSAMVCFKNGKPYKKGYRKFHIKNVEGIDDFASMHEVIYRHYGRVIKEKSSMPDLIVIDGGKGQLNAALEGIKETGFTSKIPVIAITKRFVEIYNTTSNHPIYLDKRSRGLLLLQRIRDEAHRFAINFHRQKRSDYQLKNSLETIPYIGKKTIQKLFTNFSSTEEMQNQPNNLKKIIGYKKGELILEFLRTKKN